MSLVGLTFEFAVSIVLVLVAVLCWRLDRRLTALKNGQDGVRQTVVELADATRRAEASVHDLRAASDDAGRALDAKITAARAIADELSLLVGQDERSSKRSETRREPPREPPREVRREARRERPRRARAADDELTDDAEELLDRLRGVR